MPKTIFRIKTWRCKDCDYAQDYEPTSDNHKVHFPELGRITDNCCPACHIGKNAMKKRNPHNDCMVLEENRDKMTIITVMGEDEIDDIEISDGKDFEGKEKKRKLTPQEKEEYRNKIRSDIDKFSKIAV